ncbi:MAG: hypothetical protein HYR70_12475 [Chloroflexi bacterium]|nr:hypothetical protein [Chloroflexota bacterium]MBI3339446.1 hypothetical protein [Chloroflexota bacterium]
MKIIRNEKLIKRNGRIGQYTSLGALAVLGIGMYISFQKPDLFFYSIGALIIGFMMTQVGMYFTNRWGRTPRPDEQLDASLKGLPGDTILYHYITPASHLLVGPAGIWVLLPLHQRGKVAYYKNRWRLSGGGFMQTYMTIFGQEGIGHPSLELENQINALKKYLAKKMNGDEIHEVKGVLVFTSDQIEIDDTDAPVPVLQIKKLKEFMRQKTKEPSLGSLMLQKITSALPQE